MRRILDLISWKSSILSIWELIQSLISLIFYCRSPTIIRLFFCWDSVRLGFWIKGSEKVRFGYWGSSLDLD